MVKYTEYCSFIKSPCIEEKCIFWLNEYKGIPCINQKEAFAAALALADIRKNAPSFLELLKSSQCDPLRQLLISIEPQDGRLFFNHLSNEEKVALTLSIPKDDIQKLANIHQMASLLEDSNYDGFMDCLKKEELTVHHLFQRFAWWVFEDIQFLDDKSTSRWIIECSEDEICYASKRCSEYVKDKIFSKLTKRAVANIKARHNEMRKVSVRKVRLYQYRVLRIVLSLMEAEEIKVPLKSFNELITRQKEEIAQYSPEKDRRVEVKKIKAPKPPIKKEIAEKWCPFIESECIKNKCIFWTNKSFPSDMKIEDDACLICFYSMILYSKSSDNENRPRVAIGRLALNLLYDELEEISMVFAAFAKEVKVRAVIWILSLAYPEKFIGSPDESLKKETYNVVLKSIKDNKETDNLADENNKITDDLKAFLHTRVADVVKTSSVSERSDLLNKIQELDKAIYDDIEEYGWYAFEDIVLLSDRGMQTLLKEVAAHELLLAMKMCSKELKEKIFSNMSERAAEMLAEDLYALAPVRMSEVESSQKVILGIGRKLAWEDKISFLRRKEIDEDKEIYDTNKFVDFFGRVFDRRAYDAAQEKYNRDPVDLITSLKEKSEEIAEETKNGCLNLMGAYERTVLNINPGKCAKCAKEILEGRIFVKTKDGVKAVCSEGCRSQF